MNLGILRCPICKSSFFSENSGFLRCHSCAKYFPVFENSVNFVENCSGLSEMQKVQKKYYEEDPLTYQSININDFLNSVIEGSKLKTKIFISYKQYDTYQKLKKLKIQSHESILEVGCFDGRNCFLLEKISQAKCYGIDISQNAIRKANFHSKSSNLKKSEFHVGLAENIPFRDCIFDKVVSFDVLEHISDKNSFFSEIFRVLKPGGTALVYTVSKHDQYSLHWTLREIFPGPLGRDEGGGHIYENFPHPEEIKKIGQSLKIRNIKIKSFHGFFSLFLDEYLARRIGFKIKFVFRLARFLDAPLNGRNIGNGFYIQIKK